MIKMEILNKDLRKKIIEKGCEFKLGHFGAALSCVDCISYLYDNVLTIQDIFILSKGHGAPALYAKLEEMGKNVNWKEHPELDEKSGIYATTGSLGHGLPIAVGRAYAKRLKGDNGKVYVLLGDGEIQEGSNWEALMIASKLKVDINVLIDWNKYSATDSIESTLCLDAKDLSRKLTAFGCNTYIINGHDEKELEKLKELGEGLNAVILDTIKGKGVRLLEQSHDHVYYWHLNPEEYKKALEDLI